MKTTLIQPYLIFGGRCEEALEFYRGALGATVELLLRYSDSPEPMPPGRIPPGFEKKIMHTTFHVGGSILMASDGCEAVTNFAGFSLHVCLPTEAEVDRAFNALAVGGKVEMPLSKTFWSPRFGMLTDRFGIGWMVSVAA